MPSIIHYTNCPVCGSTDILFVFTVKDYTVSGQTFEIWECKFCTLRFTQDIPDFTSIGPYYKSEDYISHSNTSKGLISRLYKAVRNRSLFQKRKLIEKITGLRKGKLLDLGSGIGSFMDEMVHHGWDVTGIEPDRDARTAALRLYKITLTGNDHFDELPANSFDVITLWHVLEHVHDLHDYVILLKKLLKENGKIFIAVPNYTSYDGMKYGAHWAAYDVPRHLYHFSPASMKWLLNTAGFQLTEEVPMWWDSFYISLLSEKYAGGHSPMLKGFFSGALSNMKARTDREKCSSLIYIAKKA